jgi:hypothetical protein
MPTRIGGRALVARPTIASSDKDIDEAAQFSTFWRRRLTMKNFLDLWVSRIGLDGVVVAVVLICITTAALVYDLCQKYG